MISGILGWLVCFWLWGVCGVQTDQTSFCHRASRQILTLVLKHVRSNHKLCFWLCQSSFQGGTNSTACWFFIINSPSVCHHSSPAGIREVIPKCLSPENRGEYQVPVSKTSTKTKVWLTENTLQAGAGSCCREKSKMVGNKVESHKVMK